MKLKKSYVFGFFIWAAAIISMFIAPNIAKKDRIAKMKAEREAVMRPYISIYESLDDETRRAVDKSDLGILRLGYGEMVLIEKDIEISEMPFEANLVRINIDNSILVDFDEEVALRNAKKVLIRRQLNSAQKKLEQHNHGVIMRGNNGEYYMIADKRKYEEYILKYGTECKSCEKKRAKKNKSKKGGIHEKSN